MRLVPSLFARSVCTYAILFFARQETGTNIHVKIYFNSQILVSSRGSFSRVTTGHIINLVSNDAQRMENFILSIQFCLLFLIDFPLTIVLLTVLVGWQSLSGTLVLLIIPLLILFISKQFAKLRIKQAMVTDKRLSALSDVITGIRPVKMYAWEWKYKDIVKKLRR
jgi:ABC-type multidrug transport system fused ATPase/permease subunit